MDDLKNLDEATLKQLLDSASSYDERSALRKEIRERKKKSGQAAGTSVKATYSRFAGGRTVVDTKTKSFLPLSTTPSNRVNSPSFLNTPPAAPSPEPTEDNRESKKAEKKREDEMKQEEEERKRQQEIEQEVKRQERIKREKELEKEAELKLEHERELEREAEVKRQEEERVRELKRIQNEEERREEEERLEKRREEERLEKRREAEEDEKRREEEERLEKRREEEERLEKRREEEERLEKRREEERLEKRREEEERLEKTREADEEMERIQEERRLLETKEQEQSEIMENEKEETPPPTIRGKKDETDLGTSPFGVQLKSHGSTKDTSPSAPESSGPEFSKVNLKKTDSSENRIKPNSNKSPGFLKTQAGSVYTSSTRERSSSYNATPTTRGTGAAPKTLADYQKLGTRNRSNTSPRPHNNKPLSDSSLQAKLVHYVNASLDLRPPISSTGTALYDTCKRPSILCNIINKSVRGTVDLRALTKTPPPSAGRREKQEAIEENMTLVVESARAIGCSITDETETNLIKGDPPTIRSFLIQMIRARVVNLPGMEDEPSTTFEDFTMLMEKLGLGSQEDHDGEQEPDIVDEPKKKLTWREHDSDRLRQDLERKDEEQDMSPQPISGTTWREERSKVTPEVDLSRPSLNAELTYEERAALRRLEREKKRKEREKLAVGK